MEMAVVVTAAVTVVETVGAAVAVPVAVAPPRLLQCGSAPAR